MRQEDRDFLRQFEKRLDDRHETLVGYIAEEFERMSRHQSRVNDRITGLEYDVRKNTTWRIKITAVGSAIAALVSGLILWTLKLWDKIKDLLS